MGSSTRKPGGTTQADYLGGYLDTPTAPAAAEAASPASQRRKPAGKGRKPRPEPEARAHQQAQRQAEPGRRERVTLYIDKAMYAELRGAALLLAANGLEPGTISALVEEALARELERVRQRHNGGKPFPALPGLPGGRPRGSR